MRTWEEKVREYLRRSPLQVPPAAPRILHLDSLSSLFTNLLLRTRESKSFTLQAAEEAVSPLPSSIPLSPVSTDSRSHSSALQSAPRTSARSIRTHFFTTSHNTSIHGHAFSAVAQRFRSWQSSRTAQISTLEFLLIHLADRYLKVLVRFFNFNGLPNRSVSLKTAAYCTSKLWRRKMNNKTGSDFCPTSYIALTAVLADANDLFTSLGGTEKGNESFFC